MGSYSELPWSYAGTLSRAGNSGSETRELSSSYSSPESSYQQPPKRRRRESQETIPPRVVEEAHCSYAQIQALITQFADLFKIQVKRKTQVEGVAQSSSRPNFFDEVEFLQKHVEGIQFPKTSPYDEYEDSTFDDAVVMKNEAVCKGQQKYLLESPKQLATFRKWMEIHGKKDDWIAQEYIETPGSAPTSFRVLVDCTGHIITSQICYGPPNSMNLHKDRGSKEDAENDPSKLLENPKSDYFLNAKAIASNYMMVNDDDSTIGGRITLNPFPISHPYNGTEKRIIRAHGLTVDPPLIPTLPTKVARIASGVGKALGTKNGKVDELVLGVDILQRNGTNDFYFLEANRRPSMAAVRDMFGSAGSVKEVDAWRWLLNGIMQRVVESRSS